MCLSMTGFVTTIHVFKVHPCCSIYQIFFPFYDCIPYRLSLFLSHVLRRVIELFWEKAMAPHSITLAWRIPWTEEPGRLQSMGLLRIRNDWATSLSLFTFMHWRRKWQPTPVFLPGESQGWWSLVGCRLWGRRVGHDWSDLAVAVAVHHC